MIKNRIYLLVLLLVLTYSIQAQVFVSSSTEIDFFSEAPMENIEAVNKKSSSLLNTKTNQLVFQVPIGAFEFEKDLMKEHFNENYMETDKFPKATFNGNLLQGVDFGKDGTYSAKAIGKFTIHGVEKERTMEGEIVIREGVISLSAKFIVLLSDHNVAIPKVVVKNIAEEVLVKVKADYKPYEKKK